MTTILLIEDTIDLAKVIQRELEAEGYSLVLAVDGLQGLAFHSQYQPDLIILDWLLPKMDGLAVLRKIRSNSVTPVLMLTARGDEVDRVLGLEVGADDYLVKPFSMRELLARVRALLRRIENVERIIQEDKDQQNEPIHYQSIYLDPLLHQTELDNVPLDLTRIEFDLLHLFLRNPGRVFSRSYLLETVWGSESVSNDRSVDNAILRLRKKIDPMGDEIEAVWGIGYRLRTRS